MEFDIMSNWRTILAWREEGVPEVLYHRPYWIVKTYQLYSGIQQKWGLFATYTREDAEALKTAIEAAHIYNPGPITIAEDHGYIYNQERFDALKAELGDRLEVLEQNYETR